MPKRILVVEDEPDILEVLRARFEAAGFEVEAATDGLTALNRARTISPDLIVLDLMLPGIDGFSICAMLKRDQQYSRIPILILSARSQPNDVNTGLGLGADAYLTKPFRAEELLEKVNDLLGAGPEVDKETNEQLATPKTTG